MTTGGGATPGVRRFGARYDAWGPEAELDRSSRLEPEERVLAEGPVGVKRRAWTPGFFRLTDRRLFLVTHYNWRPDKITEIPRTSLISVTRPEGRKRVVVTYRDGEVLRGQALRPYPTGLISSVGRPSVGRLRTVDRLYQALTRSAHDAHEGEVAHSMPEGVRREAAADYRPVARKPLTLMNVLIFPGFGVLALLALLAVPVTILWSLSTARTADQYRAAPTCTTTLPHGEADQGCRLVEHAIVTGYSGNKVSLETSDDHVLTTRLSRGTSGPAWQPGGYAVIEIWKGSVVLIGPTGPTVDTTDNPVYIASDTRWSIFLAALFLLVTTPLTVAMARRYRLDRSR